MLIGDFFSHFLSESLGTLEEVADFAQRHPERFLKAVEDHELFVAPGGTVGEPLAATLQRYEEEMRTWRSADWLAQFKEFPLHHKVFYTITERLGAQYHLLENCEELGAHPVLPLPQQSHYFKLVSATNTARLEHLSLLDSKQKSLIESISHQRLKWLSNIPVDSLVELRRNNENVTFRKRLETVIRQMHDATVGDTSKVAAELSHEIASAMAYHDRAMESLQKQYNRKHGATAVAAWTAFGATLMPSIAPFLGGFAPLGLAAKYAWDKFDERSVKASLSKSLMGVITTSYMIAKKNPQVGFGPPIGVRAEVYQEANEFCAKQNKAVETVKLELTNAGFARSAAATLEFRCKAKE